MAAHVVIPLAHMAHQEAWGPVWSMQSDDLNATLLHFAPGEGVAEHVNGEVDVLGVVVAGTVVLSVDGATYRVPAGDGFFIPRGARRALRAGEEAAGYLTCHRRRAGLWPAGATRPHEEPV